MNNRLINTKVAGGGGGCTDIVDEFDPFGDGVALYQLNGNANDVSTNYNGAWSGTESYSAGVFGQAANFSGTNYIETSLRVGQNWSVSFWINSSAFSDQQRAIQTFNSVDDVGFQFRGEIGGAMLFWATNNSSYNEITSSTIRTANTWYHIVGTYDYTNNIMNLYVNGQNDGSALATEDVSSSTYPIRIGQQVGGSDSQDYKLDQVRIFNTALDPLEVEALYTEELCICDGTVDTLDILGDGSCIATYQLDGNANDLSGNYSGQATDVSYGVGEFDLAGVFNGSSSHLDLPLKPIYDGRNNITTSFWFNVSDSGRGQLFTDYAGSNDWNLIVAINRISVGDIYIETRYGGNNVANQITGTYNDGAWHCLTIVLNQSTNQRITYIDNILKETTTISSASWTGVSTQRVTIGDLYNTNTSSYQGTYALDGSIDQVRIFNKALSAGEVTTLYNETACTIPNPIENASFHYDPTTLSDGSVSAWSDGGSINRDLELVSGTTTISKVTSGGIEYVDFSYSASDANVSYLRTGGSTLTTYPDYPTNTSVTFVQFVNINTVYDNNTSYPHIATIFNTLDSENGAFNPHIWRSGLSFSYRLGLIMNNGSRFYDIGLATSNSDIRPYGTWKMIGITFEYNQAATSYVKIYIDGALVETWSNTGTWGVLNNTLMLGRRQFTNGNRGGYKIGDTLGFFGEAKTESEMAEMYRLLKGKYGL